MNFRFLARRRPTPADVAAKLTARARADPGGRRLTVPARPSMAASPPSRAPPTACTSTAPSRT
jgi:hypothetical protein